MEDNLFRYDIKSLCEDIGVSFLEISSLYKEYFSEMRAHFLECKLLCNSADWEKLEREVHNMKGISVNLHITDVYTACYTLDYQLRTNRYENVLEKIDNIYKLFDNAENDIREYFKIKGISI